MSTRKNASYYLIRDILSCFPNEVGRNLTKTLGGHSIAKENIKEIIKDEIKNKNPQYKILIGAVIVFNGQLKTFQRDIDPVSITEELKYCCFVDKRLSLKKMAAQCILRLFTSLYYENKIVKSIDDGNSKIKKFKQFIKPDDVKEIVKLLEIFRGGRCLFSGRFIFENQGVKVDTIEELNNMLDEFYN